MAVPTIVFYVSGHGLGHASRQLELIGAISRLRPDIQTVVRTQSARWLFDMSEARSIDVQPFETDPGVVQLDSLRLDEAETATRAARFYAEFDHKAREEAARLRSMGATLVVGDIPPLAFAAADLAGIPSVAVANFTWDWIYGGFRTFDRLAPGVIDTIARGYGCATRTLRLPMHGGFASMPSGIKDVPFIARRSRRDPADTRRALGLTDRLPVVLASFGGYGVELPYEKLAADGELAVIAPGPALPDGVRYEDVVAAADVVVSKPGYGIVSECVANDTPLLYTSRGSFVEYDVLVDEMPRVMRCRFLPQDDVLAGRWKEAVHALMDEPPPAERPRVDGADVAAAEIVSLMDS